MSTWVARFFSALGPETSEAVSSRIADAANLPCFDACSRVAWNRKSTRKGYRKKTSAVVREYLSDPQNESVTLDHTKGDLVASGRLATGKLRPAGFPLPLRSYLAVPFEGGDLLEGSLSLATALEAKAGAISVLPRFRIAEKFGYSESRETRTSRS
jgi:hypothetical protein